MDSTLAALEEYALERRTLLRKNAAKHIVYRPEHWGPTVLGLRGRNIQGMLVPLGWIMFLTIVWVCLVKYGTPWVPSSWWDPDFALHWARALGSLENSFDLVRVVLSFMLVFRLGRAAVRFWEARQKAGLMIEVCRYFASSAVAHCSHSSNWSRDTLCRWTIAFPVGTKNYLRGDTGDAQELRGVLTKDEIDAMFQAPNQAVFCLDILRCTAVQWARLAAASVSDGGGGESPEVVAQGLQALSRALDTMCGTFGGLERISNTPLPFVYVAHLRSFLMIYLAFLPLVHVETWGWGTIPVVLILSWGMIGIEAAAVECECPVHNRPNHMPMDTFCARIADDVVQTLKTASLFEKIIGPGPTVTVPATADVATSGVVASAALELKVCEF